MKYTKLGRTGLDVSRICLGCMSYGGGNLGNHAWSLPRLGQTLICTAVHHHQRTRRLRCYGIA